jgi:hypothetical protein
LAGRWPAGRTSYFHTIASSHQKNSEIKIFSAKMWQNKNGTFSPVCDFVVKKRQLFDENLPFYHIDFQ